MILMKKKQEDLLNPIKSEESKVLSLTKKDLSTKEESTKSLKNPPKIDNNTIKEE